MAEDLAAWLPRGVQLADGEFARRHRILALVLRWHVPALLAIGLFEGAGLLHALIDVLPTLALVVLAALARTRAWRAGLTSLGLLSCSAALIHATGGLIESHFHIFVVLILVALYQDWRPLLVAVGFTLAHHVGVSLFDPAGAFNHDAARHQPVLWAVIHAAFVAGEVVGILLFWRVTEQAQQAASMAEAARLDATVANRSLATALEHTEAMARTDELTGLPNRRHFNAVAARELTAAVPSGGRASDHRSLCVAVLDLDHFKAVNDRYGHGVGDEVLKNLASLARRLVRAEDCFARLGGEEFGLLLPDTDLADAVALLDRLRTGLADLPLLPDDAFRVTLSAGVQRCRPDEPFETALARADAALYVAKQSGRDQVRAAEPAGPLAG